MYTFADPVKNQFNDWLRAYGIYVAIGVAVTILIIVGVLFILSKIKKD